MLQLEQAHDTSRSACFASPCLFVPLLWARVGALTDPARQRWRLHCEAMKHRAHGGSESEDESDSGASGDKVEGAASPAAIGVTPRPAAS